MLKNIFYRILLSSLFLITTACSQESEIFKDLAPDQDGTIAVAIPDSGEEAPLEEPLRVMDQLSTQEISLVNQWHDSEYDKLSFVVISAKDKKVVRSYFAERPQRLASISKIPTALAALLNVRNVNVTKVGSMLKTSNNGEASRYVRLAAKALDGLVLETQHYTAAASCPSEYLNDAPAARVAFDWLTGQLDHVDWQDASFNDGAGCHYGNFMTSLQTTKILEYAQQLGPAFAGKDFEDLLSINGSDGTWKNRNPEHKGYIFAKTGTLNPNANLAGYFYARRNGKFEPYYFAIFVNKKGGGTYSSRARNLIEGLMRHWINYYSAYPGDPISDF